jgi:hypothetical protein
MGLAQFAVGQGHDQPFVGIVLKVFFAVVFFEKALRPQVFFPHQLSLISDW